MERLVNIIPISQRELQIVRSLGSDGWTVIKESEKVFALNGAPGLLIKKRGHERWIRRGQTRPAILLMLIDALREDGFDIFSANEEAKKRLKELHRDLKPGETATLNTKKWSFTIQKEQIQL